MRVFPRVRKITYSRGYIEHRCYVRTIAFLGRCFKSLLGIRSFPGDFSADILIIVSSTSLGVTGIISPGRVGIFVIVCCTSSILHSLLNSLLVLNVLVNISHSSSSEEYYRVPIFMVGIMCCCFRMFVVALHIVGSSGSSSLVYLA